MAKKESAEWKQDAARAERKDRLARLKGSDGQKKKIESRSVGKKIALISVAVIVVLALAVWLIASTGFLPRHAKALSVNGKKVTAAEVNMFFGNYTASQQWGLAFTDEFQATLKMPSQRVPGNTLRDDVINASMPGVVFATAMLNDMEKTGFKLTDEQQKEIDDTLENLDTQISQLALQSGTTLAGFLKMYFGPGVNMKILKQDFVNSMMLTYYNEYIAEQADLSESKISQYYEEHKDEFDLYTYNVYQFKLVVKEDATAEEKAEALQKLKDDAQAALKALDNHSFIEAVKLHVSEDEAKKLTDTPSSVVKKEMLGSNVSGEIGTFLKDASRKLDDAKVLEGAETMTLIRFIRRDVNNKRPFYSVRHILIANDENPDVPKMTDEGLKAEAERILGEYKAGAMTEESFGELAKKYSKDPGSASSGGLYADMDEALQERLAAEFREWFLEAGRKPGDTGIIKTTFGYHIMYFVEHSDEKAQDKAIKDVLKDEYIDAWGDRVYAEAKVEYHSFGMKFVGKLEFFDALFGSAPVIIEPTTVPTEPTTVPTESATAPTEPAATSETAESTPSTVDATAAESESTGTTTP